MKRLNKFYSWKGLEEELDKKKKNLLWYLQSWWYRYFWNYIKDLKWKLSNWGQRSWKGWGKSDTWNFDIYLSKIIYEGIEYLKNHKHGIPNNIYEKYNKNEKEANKEWENILNSIIEGFKLVNLVSNGDKFLLLNNYPQILGIKYLTKKEQEKIELAWKYFKEYFYNLWD